MKSSLIFLKFSHFKYSLVKLIPLYIHDGLNPNQANLRLQTFVNKRFLNLPQCKRRGKQPPDANRSRRIEGGYHDVPSVAIANKNYVQY